MKLVEDYKGNQLLLFASQWSIQWVQDRNKGLQLARVRRRQILKHHVQLAPWRLSSAGPAVFHSKLGPALPGHQSGRPGLWPGK